MWCRAVCHTVKSIGTGSAVSRVLLPCTSRVRPFRAGATVLCAVCCVHRSVLLPCCCRAIYVPCCVPCLVPCWVPCCVSVLVVRCAVLCAVLCDIVLDAVLLCCCAVVHVCAELCRDVNNAVPSACCIISTAAVPGSYLRRGGVLVVLCTMCYADIYAIPCHAVGAVPCRARCRVPCCV